MERPLPPYGRGIEHFVHMGRLQYAVLVNTGTGSKRVFTNKRLLLMRAGTVNRIDRITCLDGRAQAQAAPISVAVSRTLTKDSDDLFDCRIAAALADTSERYLHFIDARVDCSERICGGEPKIVMKVPRERNVWVKFSEPLKQVADLERCQASHCVGEADLLDSKTPQQANLGIEPFA